MRVGGSTVEELSDNFKKLHNNIPQSQTICKLNGNKTCIPEKIFDNINKKINNSPLSSHKNLIIKKLSEDCGCDKEKSQDKKELCIIKNIDKEIIDKKQKDCIIYKFFKPVGSHNGNDWLNNTHVDVIQEQLYQLYSRYEYGFIHMIDNVMITPENISCINHPIKSIIEIDFVDVINNNKMDYYGVVYNTDPSHRLGQHWFSILFNFTTEGTKDDPYLIEYFNSSGLNISNIEFKEFLEKLSLEISYETKKEIRFKKVTHIQHQNSTTGNCGIYALYYIWARLNNTSLEYFNDPKNKITDKLM